MSIGIISPKITLFLVKLPKDDIGRRFKRDSYLSWEV